MRLIDADALIEMCENPFVDFIDMDDVRNAPTIDAVPVVRCGECKYWEEESTFCLNLNEEGCYGSETTADWFCADGERKDGAE